MPVSEMLPNRHATNREKNNGKGSSARAYIASTSKVSLLFQSMKTVIYKNVLFLNTERFVSQGDFIEYDANSNRKNVTVQSDRTFDLANENINTDGISKFKSAALDSENAHLSIDVESLPSAENPSTHSAHPFSKMEVKK